MKIYATLNDTGQYSGFYQDDIHKSIPKDAVEITEKQRADFLHKQANPKKELNYREKRAAEYDAVGDQLDAILKGFNQMRLDGTNLPDDLDHTVNRWLAVKAKHPKPEGV